MEQVWFSPTYGIAIYQLDYTNFRLFFVKKQKQNRSVMVMSVVLLI